MTKPDPTDAELDLLRAEHQGLYDFDVIIRRLIKALRACRQEAKALEMLLRHVRGLYNSDKHDEADAMITAALDNPPSVAKQGETDDTDAAE